LAVANSHAFSPAYSARGFNRLGGEIGILSETGWPATISFLHWTLFNDEKEESWASGGNGA
jgi:hypothetical protein